MPSFADDADVQYEVLSFSDLDGWGKDDHAAALETFQRTCAYIRDPAWKPVCNAASAQSDARKFFELLFRPVLITDSKRALFTAYFEPELTGSRYRSARYAYPVYSKPPEADGLWLTRQEILEGERLSGRGLEIAWVDDPVELFFLQIQGSGRIRLPNGRVIRVGYGGSNGHQYKSIGQELVRRGTYSRHEVSAEVIKSWVRRNPVIGKELLYHNPSYVFFREVSHVPAHLGPLGAMNLSLTTKRSIAVDPRFTPLGAPVWIEKDGSEPMRRLMIAQDTGSAIKGAQRVDIFMGTGDAAGKEAGRISDPGRMVVLMPIQSAYALLPGDYQ